MNVRDITGHLQLLPLKVMKETTKLKSESEFFGGTSVSCKVKDKKNLRKLYFKHNVSRVVLMFFTKKYNLFVAFPRTSCGNLIHCKKISFTS